MWAGESWTARRSPAPKKGQQVGSTGSSHPLESPYAWISWGVAALALLAAPGLYLRGKRQARGQKTMAH
jgi:hypothetical protein